MINPAVAGSRDDRRYVAVIIKHGQSHPCHFCVRSSEASSRRMTSTFRLEDMVLFCSFGPLSISSRSTNFYDGFPEPSWLPD
jgi:hypothetical protein